MNKLEAISAMVDGEYVKRDGWIGVKYMYIDKWGFFKDQDGEDIQIEEHGSHGWDLYSGKIKEISKSSHIKALNISICPTCKNVIFTEKKVEATLAKEEE